MAGTDEADPRRATGRRRAAVRFALLVAVVLAGLVAVRFTPLGTLASREDALELLERLRTAPSAWLIFTGLYAAAAVLALPGSVLTLTGGAVFGVWPGLPINLAAATIGASLAFLLARTLGRDFVGARLRGRAADLDHAVARHGFRTIFILRLIPLVPFNALNYGAGLSAVRFRDYFLASVVGMIPATFAYTYFADSLLAGSLEARRDALLHTLLAAALLIGLSLLPLVVRRRRMGSGEPDG